MASGPRRPWAAPAGELTPLTVPGRRHRPFQPSPVTVVARSGGGLVRYPNTNVNQLPATRPLNAQPRPPQPPPWSAHDSRPPRLTRLIRDVGGLPMRFPGRANAVYMVRHAAAAFRFFSATAICPAEVLKCRLQVHRSTPCTGTGTSPRTRTAAAAGTSPAPLAPRRTHTGNTGSTGVVGTAAELWRTEGGRGFFRGLTALWARDVPFYVAFFAAYTGYIDAAMRWQHVANKQDLAMYVNVFVRDRILYIFLFFPPLFFWDRVPRRAVSARCDDPCASVHALCSLVRRRLRRVMGPR